MRLNKLFHLFAWLVLALFFFLVIGLLQMRVAATGAIGANNQPQKNNALELGLRTILHIRTAEAAPFLSSLAKTTNTNIILKSGETATLTVFLKNTGSRAWRNSGKNFISYYADVPRYRTSNFKNKVWFSSIQPSKLKETIIRPGQIGSFIFSFTAPAASGVYKEKFRAAAENLAWIPKSNLKIIITVPENEVIQASNPVPEEKLSGEEPRLRVGLFKLASNEQTKISYAVPYQLMRKNGEILMSIGTEMVTALKFDAENKKYIASVNGQEFNDVNPFRLVPNEAQSPATILTDGQLHRWSATANDNQFRGVIEIYFSPTKNEIWIINELPLESYLKGLGEASDNFNPEYLKALYAAARTYALFHFKNPYKHSAQRFTLDAVYDQVYRGYKQENRSPHSARLIDETNGFVMTYNNEVVITPYYSESDGRTRSWQEVFGGGEKPWLVSVPTPADQGKPLLGHGVGMSASDARARAETGALFRDILSYYYHGVEIKKMY